MRLNWLTHCSFAFLKQHLVVIPAGSKGESLLYVKSKNCKTWTQRICKHLVNAKGDTSFEKNTLFPQMVLIQTRVGKGSCNSYIQVLWYKTTYSQSPFWHLLTVWRWASYLNHLGIHFLFCEIRLNNLPHRIAMKIKWDYEIIHIVSPINVSLIIIGIASFPSTK